MWINFYGSPKCKKQEEVSERKKNHYKHYFPFASSLSTAFQLLYSVTETPNLEKMTILSGFHLFLTIPNAFEV